MSCTWFLEFKIYPTVMLLLRHLLGHVVHSEDFRRVLSAWALGTRGELGGHPEGTLNLGTRDTWHTRNVSGGWLSVWASGTRGTLGRYLEKVLPVGALGMRGVPGTLPG